MRPSLLLIALVLAATPLRPASGAVRLDVASGWASPSGALEAGPGVSLRGAVSLLPQLHAGLEVTRSVHGLEGAPDVTLEQLTLSGTWSFDAAELVPLVSGFAGLLRVAGSEGTEPVYGLGAGLEWWPVRPLEGPTLAVELRYLGLVDPDILPFVTWLGVRAGWVF